MAATDTSKSRPANRLLHETSPYLQQHAYNPVDWYPWGEEALSAARERNMPIFLSIGYSACHWCHVMEHESFENPEIAKLMNEHFINIKVDREERPDLDQIYMNAVQLLTRHGGWPMSVFLTPDLKPFYGGTYFPPESRMGMPGFGTILKQVHHAWVNRRDEVDRGAEELTSAIQQLAAAEGDRSELNESLLRQAMRKLIGITDRRHGGFGQAPKFPHAMDLRVLLRCAKRFGEDDALAVARLTLDKMVHGGIYDHLGGGFHRYSTDERWLVPHFEKMLYDNALLTPAYLEAYQATGDPLYARVARETLDYVLREMTQPQGGFYSTQDADSEGEEGKFFVWTEEEIDSILDSQDAELFKYVYDVSAEGNWEGHTILNRPKTNSQVARLRNVSPEELEAVLAKCRQALYAVRERRVHPGRDDKVLVSWNGMMISAMAQAAQVLNEPRYAEAAKQAAGFLLTTVRSPEGQLRHSYKDGQARFNAYLDDYACLIDGLVDLYQAVFEPMYLSHAVRLSEEMVSLFHDDENNGFFYTPANHEALIARNKENYDGSTPSGNSMAATSLIRLGRLCGRTDLEEKGVQTLGFLSPVLAQSPTAAGQALIALDFLLGPTREVVVVDGSQAGDSETILQQLHSLFVPNKVIARTPGDNAPASPELSPLLEGKTARHGQLTVYVCERGACQEPIIGVAAASEAIRSW